MKPRLSLLSCLTCLAACSATFAQTSAPPQNSGFLQQRLTNQQKRADLVLDEVKAADERVEGRIDGLVDTLRMVGDSKDSRTKVLRMKEQTIKDLTKLTDYYAQKRAWLKEEMRRPSYNLTQDEKEKLIARFDDRIEKRVDQILVLYKTLPQHQDYERYTTTGANWWGGTNYAESEDYKQNQRLTTRTNVERDKLSKALQDSIARLELQNRTLAQQRAGASGALSDFYANEIVKNGQLLKTRREQLKEVLVSPAEDTRPISGKEAQALDSAMKVAVNGLKTEITQLFDRYAALLRERSALNDLRSATKTGS